MWHAEFSSGAKSKKSLIYSSMDGTLFALNAIRVTCCAPGLPGASSLSSTTKSSSTNDSGPVGATNTKHTENATAMTPRNPPAIRLFQSTKTLSVLFQFILPMPPPTLQDLNVDELEDILTAARRYKVYTAISTGESRLLSLAGDEDADILFFYGMRNKLPRFMDAGAPGVYRDVERERLLRVCNMYGMIYAWTRYQLLWDRIIEEACNVARSSAPPNKKGKEIYEYYSDLRSLQWETTHHLLPNGDGLMQNTPIEGPKISYCEFLAMLDEDILVIEDSRLDPPLLEGVSVKHINDEIKRKIKEMPTFSSFLESNQKDGDVALRQDELDSEEEEEEKQDGSG